MADIATSQSRRAGIRSDLVTRTVQCASAARAEVHRRRLRRPLEEAVPAVRDTISLCPDWHVQRVLPTVGDVSVALVGTQEPAAVLKLARSARGAAALERSGAVVDMLASDTRLTGWSDLLPRRLGQGRTPEGNLVVLEQLLRGQDARTAIRTAAADKVLATVLDTVGTLHEQTARETTIDRALLGKWVDEPVAVLEHWYSDTLSKRALDRLRHELYDRWEGRTTGVGWIHGDLCPGNVLVDARTGRVTGLLDWERAVTAGLPALDAVHLRLTVEMVRQRKELGALVRDLWRRPAISDDIVLDPALVLLCWLHHVSGVVAKSQHYSRGGLWARRNIDAVLSSLLPSTRAQGRARPVARPRNTTWRR